MMQAIPVRSPLTVPRVHSHELHFSSLRTGLGFARGQCLFTAKLQRTFRGNAFGGEIRSIGNSGNDQLSPWDENPYELLPGGRKAYLDEQVDPPKELIPLETASYNPAVYLWKKIEDIPEERRHWLLHLLKPRQYFVARMAKIMEECSLTYQTPHGAFCYQKQWRRIRQDIKQVIGWTISFKNYKFQDSIIFYGD